MKIYKNIDQSCKYIKDELGDPKDLVVRNYNIKGKKACILFLESVSSDDKISNFLSKSITKVLNNFNFLDDIFSIIKNNIYNSKTAISKDYDEMMYYLFSGFTIILVNGYNKALIVETKETLDRGIEAPKTEITVKGPKDSFTENYNKNIGLIRKRIKDENLWFDELKIGLRSKCKVSICYIKDIALKSNVEEIITKLEDINIDAILDTSYLRDYLTSDIKTSFPVVINTERPDIVCASLLEGKIAVIVENTPFVLVIPGLLNNFLHASEDSYNKASNVIFTRAIRLFAMLITLFVPALYVAATTYNQEIIPDTLLVSLAVQRTGVPFPTSFAVFLFMIVFEILRESDIRLPENMGSSISIVGALILGEAAVTAGIVSPIVIIVVATSSTTGMLFTDQDIINAFRQWKFIFLIFASFMGLIGLLVSSILFVIKLCSIEILNIPYLTPISPLFTNSLKDTIYTVSRNKMKKRPKYLTNNLIRGNTNEK